jgi:hypothetical protein
VVSRHGSNAVDLNFARTSQLTWTETFCSVQFRATTDALASRSLVVPHRAMLAHLTKHDKRKCLRLTKDNYTTFYKMASLKPADDKRDKKIITKQRDDRVFVCGCGFVSGVAEGTICLCCCLYARLGFCFLVSSRVCTYPHPCKAKQNAHFPNTYSHLIASVVFNAHCYFVDASNDDD